MSITHRIPELFLLAVFSLATHTSLGSVCVREYDSPLLPSTLCAFPDCFNGQDCTAPTINLSTAGLSISEPAIQWRTDECPASTGSKGCWKVSFVYDLKLEARDASGVAEIGVHLTKEFLNNTTVRQKYFQPVSDTDSQNRFAVQGGISEYAAPGSQLRLQAYELCARDRLGNEACVYPLKKGAFATAPTSNREKK